MQQVRAVLLHILADAMGSVGAVVSSLLVRYRQWQLADPLCSLLIAALILLTAAPLLARTLRQLREQPRPKGTGPENYLARTAADRGTGTGGRGRHEA